LKVFMTINEIVNAVKKLDLSRTKYGKAPIPSDLDCQITEIISSYKSLEKENRNLFFIKIDEEKVFTQEHSNFFIFYSERMAILAVRENNPIHILNGLVAIAIENFRYDKREDLLILPLHVNSATKIGAGLREIFEKAADYAVPPVSETFKTFAGYDPKKIHIESMGYVEEVTPEGFNYRRTW